MEKLDADKGIITELPPIPESESYYAVCRHNKVFDYPVHRHEEFELNFLSGCAGVLRVVGDSIEELGDSDLVFVGGGVPHGWLNNGSDENGICEKEVTLQFSPKLFGDYMLRHSPFAPFKELMANSVHGIVYGAETSGKVAAALDELLEEDDYFERFVKFLRVIQHLAIARDYRFLVRTLFTADDGSEEATRVALVYDYIRKHFKDKIRQPELAGLVGMTPQAFARFFKLRTGRTTGDFIMETRIAEACRQLYFSDKSVSEICYLCGFHNISHFSRSFRQFRGMSPSEFREKYKVAKISKDFNILGMDDHMGYCQNLMKF